MKENKVRNLFDCYNICMNIYDNKISIVDRKINIKEYEFDIKNSFDQMSRIKELVELTVKEIPFSFVRSKIIILIPDDINKNDLNKIEEIILKNGKNKFREMVFISDGLSIIGAFEELNRCIYLVKSNNRNKILGFAACAGEMITKMMYFDNSNSIDFMINQVNNEIHDDYLLLLKEKIKKVDLDSLWENNNIILSFDPEYYYNKKILDIKNSYIPNILHIGLTKCAIKMFYKNRIRTNGA
jgi:hypothetical protein